MVTGSVGVSVLLQGEVAMLLCNCGTSLITWLMYTWLMYHCAVTFFFYTSRCASFTISYGAETNFASEQEVPLRQC